MYTKTKAQVIANLQKEVRELQTVFTSKHHIAFIEVKGEGAGGASFSYDIIIDSNDPEFRHMVEQYGARKSAQVLALQTEITAVI